MTGLIVQSTHPTIERETLKAMLTARASQAEDYYSGWLSVDKVELSTQYKSAFSDRSDFSVCAPNAKAAVEYGEYEVRYVDQKLYKKRYQVSMANDNMTNVNEVGDKVKILMEGFFRQRFKDAVTASKGKVNFKLRRDTTPDDPLDLKTTDVKTAAQDFVTFDDVPPLGDIGITVDRLMSNIGVHAQANSGSWVSAGGDAWNFVPPFWVATPLEYTDILRDRPDAGFAVAGNVDYKPFKMWDEITDIPSTNRKTVLGYGLMQLPAWVEDSFFTAIDFDGYIEENVGTGNFELVRNTFLSTSDAVDRVHKVESLVTIDKEPGDATLWNISGAFWSAALRARGNRIRVIPVRRVVPENDVINFYSRRCPIYFWDHNEGRHRIAASPLKALADRHESSRSKIYEANQTNYDQLLSSKRDCSNSGRVHVVPGKPENKKEKK